MGKVKLPDKYICQGHWKIGMQISCLSFFAWCSLSTSGNSSTATIALEFIDWKFTIREHQNHLSSIIRLKSTICFACWYSEFNSSNTSWHLFDTITGAVKLWWIIILARFNFFLAWILTQSNIQIPKKWFFVLLGLTSCCIQFSRFT